MTEQLLEQLGQAFQEYQYRAVPENNEWREFKGRGFGYESKKGDASITIHSIIGIGAPFMLSGSEYDSFCNEALKLISTEMPDADYWRSLIKKNRIIKREDWDD